MATKFKVTMRPRVGGAGQFIVGSFYQLNSTPTIVCVYLGDGFGWQVGTSSVKITMKVPAEWTEVKDVDITIQEEIN